MSADHNTMTPGALRVRHRRLVERAAQILDGAEGRMFTKTERDERIRVLREAVEIEEALARRRGRRWGSA